MNLGYGYGIERFFWSLISACGILFIGAGITIYHSIDSLMDHTHAIHEFNYLSICVLVLAFFVESVTLFVALQIRVRAKIFFRKFSPMLTQ